MGFFGNLFKRKTESTEETHEVPSAVNSETGRRFMQEQCSLCSELIGTEKWKRTQSVYFHKKCFKKEAKKIHG